MRLLETISVPSAFFIGGVDPLFYEGSIHMVNVVREFYWQVRLTALWVGDTQFCCDDTQGNGYVVVDSGTSFNTLPHDEGDRFFNIVDRGHFCRAEDPSTFAAFPVIRYVLVSQKIHTDRQTDSFSECSLAGQTHSLSIH